MSYLYTHFFEVLLGGLPNVFHTTETFLTEPFNVFAQLQRSKKITNFGHTTRILDVSFFELFGEQRRSNTKIFFLSLTHSKLGTTLKKIVNHILEDIIGLDELGTKFASQGTLTMVAQPDLDGTAIEGVSTQGSNRVTHNFHHDGAQVAVWNLLSNSHVCEKVEETIHTNSLDSSIVSANKSCHNIPPRGEEKILQEFS